MTTPRERDRLLELWLAGAQPEVGPPVESCLDAETAAAWFDGSLTGAARREAEAHVTTCARCQALMATVVRLDEAASVEAEPAASPWRRWLNWAVPIGAAATAVLAVTVWLNVPAEQAREVVSIGSTRSTDVPLAGSGQAEAPAVQAPEPERPLGSASVPGPAPAVAPGAVGRVAAAPASPTPRAATESAAKNATGAGADALASGAAPGPAEAAATAAAPAPLAGARAADAAQTTSAVARERQEVARAQGFELRERAALDIVSPDPRTRWRITDTAVQRSQDGGSTWATVVPQAPGRLLAGSAASPSVCWMVGEMGLVLRTTDGLSFVQVNAPVAAHLVTVAAISATSATVSTADGRRFTTSDGGASWAAQ